MARLAVKYPLIVFCLFTALKIHGPTTQNPHEVWIAILPNARIPTSVYPPLHVVRFSDLGAGTKQIAIDGVTKVLVTTVAKTVADCFKFRNKIGLDFALEAMREAWRLKKVSMDELWEATQLCRVANVMRLYLESLGMNAKNLGVSVRARLLSKSKADGVDLQLLLTCYTLERLLSTPRAQRTINSIALNHLHDHPH